MTLVILDDVPTRNSIPMPLPRIGRNSYKATDSIHPADWDWKNVGQMEATLAKNTSRKGYLQCYERIRCRCKKGCEEQCNCGKGNLKCTVLCSSGDNCQLRLHSVNRNNCIPRNWTKLQMGQKRHFHRLYVVLVITKIPVENSITATKYYPICGANNEL